MMTLRKGVKVTLITIVLLGVFLTPVIANAQMQELNDVAEQSGLKGEGSETDLMTIIANLINVVLGLVGVILLILFIYAGFLWMTAGGDSDQVKKAKSIFKNAIIGLLIVVLSYAISSFVINRMSSVSGGSQETPQEDT